MTRDLYPEILSAIQSDMLYPFFAVQLNFDLVVLRMWSGYGDLNINGANFIGVGTLLSVSSIEETSELYAAGASLSLSGVPTDMISLALTESYQGRRAYIYFGVLSSGTTWILTNGIWNDASQWSDTSFWADAGITASQVYSGYLDQMSIQDDADTATISVTIENKLIDLERVRTFNYSSQTQKIDYPEDLGFDFVDSLQGKTYNWGRK